MSRAYSNRIKNTFVRIDTRSKHIQPSDLLAAGYPNYNIRYGHNFNEIEKWCDKTFGKNNVCWFGYLFFFQTEQQKMLFMLRWQ